MKRLKIRSIKVNPSTLRYKNVHFLFFLNNSVKINNNDFNNFSTSNPEKIWHERRTLLSTSSVRCSHFTLGNPKKSFSAVSFVHTLDYLRYLGKYRLQLLYCSLAVYLLLFSYHLHSPITASGARYRRSACIGYQSTIRTSCGSGLLRHGMNFSRAWCTMQLISGEKDWKHVSMQKVVTLNTCCDVACLTFQLPHITTSSV